MAWNCIKELSDFSPTTIVCTALVVILGILYLWKNRNILPGPRGLPLVGYWPYLENETVHIQLQNLMKEYGDAYSFNVAGQLCIHLGSIKAAKEAHVTKADCFEERPTMYSLLMLLAGNGLISSNGEKWKSLRKFFMQSFKEYGITATKGYMSGPIYDSVNVSIEALKAKKGSPVNIISILNDSSAKIFRCMMFNDGEIKDEELKGVLESYQALLPVLVSKNFLLMGDIARYFILPTFKEFKSFMENHLKMIDYLTAIVRRHEESYDENNIRDAVDSFIKARNEKRQKGDPTAEYFSENALVYSLTQMVGDGILGITVFLAYFIHALLEYPEEQDKIYKELMDVVGTDRQVTLEDRNKLPYTNAFMNEVMRTTEFFTLLPSLKCTKDTTLNGYRIPKGAVTIYNLWACHRDPKVFEDPEEFKPSRYLSVPGKPKAEAHIAFGVGRRSCAGEAFVTSQVFIYLTSLVKNFQLHRPEGSTKKNFYDGVLELCADERK